MLVVIDTETTGLDPQTHDLIQVCIMPLYDNFSPMKEIKPFFIQIKPKKFINSKEYLEQIKPAMAVNKIDLDELMDKGIEAHQASVLFDKWWEMISGNQQFSVLAQNFPFDRGFLIEWLGAESFKQYFNHRYRDLYGASFYLNDRAQMLNYDIPFKYGLSLGKVASVLGINQLQAHDAYSDCLTTAEAYRRLLILELTKNA